MQVKEFKEAIGFWLVVVLFLTVLISMSGLGCTSPSPVVYGKKFPQEYKKAEKQSMEEWLQSCLRTQPWKSGSVGEYVCPRIIKAYTTMH